MKKADRFGTIPLCLLKLCSRGSIPPMGLSKRWQMITPFATGLKIAEEIIPGARFVKDGHTSAVYVAPSGQYVVNVARDTLDAGEDLVCCFNALRDAYEGPGGPVAKVDRIFFGGPRKDVPVAVVERIASCQELSLMPDRETFSILTWPEGPGMPVVHPLTRKQSDEIYQQITDIELLTGLDYTVLHGDFVLRSNGQVVAVACDTPRRRVYTPYRHTKSRPPVVLQKGDSGELAKS